MWLNFYEIKTNVHNCNAEDYSLHYKEFLKLLFY